MSVIYSSLSGGRRLSSVSRCVLAHLLAVRGGGRQFLALSTPLDVLPALVSRPVSAELQLTGGTVVVRRRPGTSAFLVQLTRSLA